MSTFALSGDGATHPHGHVPPVGPYPLLDGLGPLAPALPGGQDLGRDWRAGRVWLVNLSQLLNCPLLISGPPLWFPGFITGLPRCPLLFAPLAPPAGPTITRWPTASLHH